ncbi:SPOR domain-containing protein [Chitiniphilus purpureus]|uniref:SPOR domain-containing protein n=1 Tax=Chitiniphilus purpureus TaxID=2981137 RepID=A0ABY6DHF0_9NEIS|nr:SPOR domain-containing protein [Chitiniphilus sp. CD1]UXY13741.1 SPOR domain-containing protein [Chitiniphilus sp. CD1]
MARDNVSEELLQLRKRARRRLVGAIALVLFALTVLWTVMDAEPPQNLAQDAQPVVIEASAPSVAASATPPVPTAQSASAALAALPGRLVTQQTGNVADAVTPPTPEPRPSPLPSPIIPKPKPTPPPKPTVAPKPKADPKRILEGLDEPAAAGAPVFVQIGAYGDAAKAAQIADKLKAAGLPARAEPVTVKGVGLTRVRIGPLPRPQGEAAQRKAAALGYTPQLVSK